MSQTNKQYPAVGKKAKRRGLVVWRTWLLVSFYTFLLTTSCFGQGLLQIRVGPTVPANCTPLANNGVYYKNSGSNIGLYECTALNTWTFRGSINFGGTLTPPAMSGDVNDYNATGLTSAFALRIDG